MSFYCRWLSVMIARVLLKAHGGDSIDPAARNAESTTKKEPSREREDAENERKDG